MKKGKRGTLKSIPVPPLHSSNNEFQSCGSNLHSRGPMSVERLPLTDDDENKIINLMSTGYGWGRYAASIKAQGWISSKQRDTLDSMSFRVTYHNSRVAFNRSLSTAANYRGDYEEPPGWYTDFDIPDGG